MHNDPLAIAVIGFLCLAAFYGYAAYQYPHERAIRIGQLFLLVSISVIIGSGLLLKLA